MESCAIILAAGDGKRMKSARPKVLCEVLLKPMLAWVLDGCRAAGIQNENLCVITSDRPEPLWPLLDGGVQSAVQAERLGTGHAVRCAEGFLRKKRAEGVREAAVLCGDAPFVGGELLAESLRAHRAGQNAVTVLTARVKDPGRYGRILRGADGAFRCIREAADASPDELLIDEINSGAYWFSIDYLLRALPLLQNGNAQNEYYLTDTVELAPRLREKAGAFCCPDPAAALGANDRRSLAELTAAAREKVFGALYDAGVDIPVADGVMISPDASIGRDTLILPGCILKGRVKVGEGCVIGPNTTLIDCEIGDRCTVDSSRIEKSRLGNGVRVGPFAQIRPGCEIAGSVKIGNFVELKNSTVGEKTSFAHLTYCGDSDFGAHVNVGCGVVTVNYDGNAKYRTVVGDGCFIGCNTNLVAPVRVGKGAYVAAATTVTEDVPGDALAIGRVRQQHKEGWAKAMRAKKPKP